MSASLVGSEMCIRDRSATARALMTSSAPYRAPGMGQARRERRPHRRRARPGRRVRRRPRKALGATRALP
eukprot:4503290-Alexandrium_andersonii.AAC.1